MTCFPYLGSEIFRLLKARGLTLQKLAQLVGVREVTILNLGASKFFKVDILEQILTFLGFLLAIIPDNGNKSLESVTRTLLDELASRIWTWANSCISRCQRLGLEQRQEYKR